MMTSKSFPLYLLLVLLFTASCSSEDTNSTQDISVISPTVIDNLELFIGVEDNIANPFQMEILPDGRLAVLDTDELKVFFYNTDGTRDKEFGRRGKGPGEFVAPRGLNVSDSTVSVIDVGLDRVNQFDLDGNFIQNYNIKKKTSFFGTVSTGDSMEYYTVANGYNGKLIGHRNVSTGSVRYFGEAPVENPPPVNDQDTFAEHAANGEVPDAIGNDLLMYYKDGNLYVLQKAYYRLQKYSDGKLIWDKKIALPVNKIIFENFLEDVRESRSGFAVLSYSEDIFATSNNIYLLWNGTSEQPQQLIKVNTNGNVENIYKLPMFQHIYFSSVAVNDATNRIYLTSPRSAEVYTTVLSN